MDNERCRRATGREAAERYVEVDANADDPERLEALTEWLERSPDHEAAFERCEAAMMLAGELAASGALEDAVPARPAALSRGRTKHGLSHPMLRARARQLLGVRVLPVEWWARPAVAWSVAALAVIWAVAATVERGASAGVGGDSARIADTDASGDAGAGFRTAALPGSVRNETLPSAADVAMPAASTAAGDESVAAIEKRNPVGLLPGEIVVDSQSVAVLPFDGVLQAFELSSMARDAEGGVVAAERIAMQLHDEVVRQLSGIPGVFVVDGRSSAVYAGGEFGPDQIAAFLGVRGVVAADVSVDGRIVRVSLRMTDAVNDGRRTETTFERPLDELPAVRTAIVSNIADALASTAF